MAIDVITTGSYPLPTGPIPGGPVPAGSPHQAARYVYAAIRCPVPTSPYVGRQYTPPGHPVLHVVAWAGGVQVLWRHGTTTIRYTQTADEYLEGLGTGQAWCMDTVVPMVVALAGTLATLGLEAGRYLRDIGFTPRPTGSCPTCGAADGQGY